MDDGDIRYGPHTRQCVDNDSDGTVRIMQARSSFRDTVARVRHQFQRDIPGSRESVHLIRYDSIGQLFGESSPCACAKRSNSHADLPRYRLRPSG